NITVDVHIFTDHTLDGNESNGTMRTVAFQLVPLEGSPHGVVVEVLANGTEWTSDGVARVSLEAGAYRVVIGPQDPLDSNSSVWNTGFIGDAPEGVYGLSNGTEQLHVSLAPEWLTHVNLTNQSGGQVGLRIVTFISADDSSPSFTRYVDENGTISEYLPEGNWIVAVDPYISGSDLMAVHRSLISIDESTAPVDLSIQTVSSAHYQLNVTDASNDQPLQSYVLTAHSGDGLGNITLSSTGEDGMVDIHLMPGNWTVSLNRTDGQTRWIIDDFSIGDLSSSNGSQEISVEAERWVNLGGNLFWDLDNDDLYDINEGVGGTNVSITDNMTGETVVVVSNDAGSWSEFVRVKRNFTISAEKDGFSSNQEFIEIVIDTVSRDIEMSAATVSVSGIVDVLPAERWDEISSSTSITLYPGLGFERESVSPDLVMEDGNWTGEWSAIIEPGDWVVYVVYDSNNLSESQVGVAALDATISNGGEVNITLENAGLLRIGTQWTDFNGAQYTLADTSVDGAEMISDPSISLNLVSRGAGWNITVDSTGSSDLLMPAGTVSMDSEFHTTERDTVMEYSAGQSVTVGESQESPLTILEYNRREDRSLNVTVVDSVGEAEELDGAEDVILAPAGISYDPVTFTFNVEFEGTTAVETYTVTSDIVGADSPFWTLEIRNESITDENAEGAWNDTLTMDMGLEDGIDLNRSVTLRVTGPNQTTARHADLGHALNIRFTASDGSVYNERVTVRIPQTHDIGFDEDEIQSIYGVTPGDSTRIELSLENDGNGDDTVSVNLTSLAPTDWNVLGASSTTIGASSSQSYSFDVYVPSNATAGEYDVIVRLTSEDGMTTSNRTIRVEVARPIISIVGDSITTESSTPPIAGELTEIFVTVRNTGIVDASDITLEAVLKENYDSEPLESTRLTSTQNIPAGGEVNYTFMVDYSGYNSGDSPWLEFTVNSSGQIFDDPQPVPEFYQESLIAPGAESTSSWLPLLVLIIVGLILYGASKVRGGRRPF
ncbi:MAG: NEW3 domain-containing protein, partial [Candidatus Thalassarchaeaceae archaeon]|nr:NEW3 domain-containing protein [Candidatus Thalassarchaeaceae archaeon]